MPISPAIPLGFWLTPLASPAGPTRVIAVKMPPVHAAPNHANRKFAQPAKSAPARRVTPPITRNSTSAMPGNIPKSVDDGVPRCIASRHPATAPSAADRQKTSSFSFRTSRPIVVHAAELSRMATRRLPCFERRYATKATTIIATKMAHSTRNASGDLKEMPKIVGRCTTSNRLPSTSGCAKKMSSMPRANAIVASAK